MMLYLELISYYIIQLNTKLPSRTIGHCWALVYSTFQHGFSLKTLYRKMEFYDTPVLLVVMDDAHQVSTNTCYVVMQRIQEYPTSQLCFLGIHTCLKESMYTRKMQVTS